MTPDAQTPPTTIRTMTLDTQTQPTQGRRAAGPRILVYSSLFPSVAAPTAGTFIRERMFRVARRLPLVVVAPQPWSPFDWMVRLVRKGFRPMGAAREAVDGIEILRPRFLSLPGVLKRLDSRLMAWSTLGCVRAQQRRFGVDIIDAHFAYPDGHAATLIGRRLGLPVTITLRGSKDQRLIGTDCEPSLRDALAHADRVIAVSDSLRHEVAEPLGLPAGRVKVIGNGVDLEKFEPVDRTEARRRLGLDADAKVLIGVGNLIELKGFHRVVPLLPALRERFGKLVYLIVGGGTGAGRHERAHPGAGARARGGGLRSTVRPPGARGTEVVLRRRRCVCARHRLRGLGQRATGGDGLRRAGGDRRAWAATPRWWPARPLARWWSSGTARHSARPWPPRWPATGIARRCWPMPAPMRGTCASMRWSMSSRRSLRRARRGRRSPLP